LQDEWGHWHLWYTGYDGTHYRICHASAVVKDAWYAHKLSVDIRRQGRFDTQHAAFPVVLYDSGVFKMWYSVFDGETWRILYQESPDGVIWGDPWLATNPGDKGLEDAAGAAFPWVMLEDQKFTSGEVFTGAMLKLYN
jgi:hypothetical protein